MTDTVEKSTPIVFILSGAGLSAESGLGTFRGEDGLWNKIDPYEVDSASAFASNPEKVFEFMNKRIQRYALARPNEAHLAIAKFSFEMAGKATVINVTQNVDSLLEIAGCPYVHHLHGSFALSKCTKCNKLFPRMGLYKKGNQCPVCLKVGLNVRPSVVLFEEKPYGLEWIFSVLGKTDYFVSIGTSGTVYPAAQFVDAAKAGGCKNRWLCNLEHSGAMDSFNKYFIGKATELVPKVLEKLKAEILGV